MPYYLKTRSFGVSTRKSADAGLPYRTWLSVAWRSRTPPAQDWPEEIAFNVPPPAQHRPKAGNEPGDMRKSRGRVSSIDSPKTKKKRLLTPHPLFSSHMALGMSGVSHDDNFASHLSRRGDLVLGFSPDGRVLRFCCISRTTCTKQCCSEQTLLSRDLRNLKSRGSSVASGLSNNRQCVIDFPN